MTQKQLPKKRVVGVKSSTYQHLKIIQNEKASVILPSFCKSFISLGLKCLQGF